MLHKTPTGVQRASALKPAKEESRWLYGSLIRACAGVESDPRFRGIGRLYGGKGLARLRNSHVCVIGLGGVGSWVSRNIHKHTSTYTAVLPAPLPQQADIARE